MTKTASLNPELLSTANASFGVEENAVQSHQQKGEAALVHPYAEAEQRMKRGKQLVTSGFVVAVGGIIAYCIVCFSAGVNQKIGTTLFQNPGYLVIPALGLIGLGTLFWLIGSFLYLSGSMDSNPEGTDQQHL